MDASPERKPQTVYLVSCADYDYCTHHGIFSRREDAEKCAAMLNQCGESAEVEECVLDAAVNDVIYTGVSVDDSLRVVSADQHVAGPGENKPPRFWTSPVYLWPYRDTGTHLQWQVQGDKEQAVAFVRAKARALQATNAWGNEKALAELWQSGKVTFRPTLACGVWAVSYDHLVDALRFDISSPLINVTMPCGQKYIVQTLADIPQVSVPCACGDPAHWFVKYEAETA